MPRKSTKSKKNSESCENVAELAQTIEYVPHQIEEMEIDTVSSPSYELIETKTISQPFKRILYQIKDYYCDYHEIDSEYQKNVADTIGQFMVEREYSAADEMNAELGKIAAAYRHDMWGIIEIVAEMYQSTGVGAGATATKYKGIYYFSIYHQEDENHGEKIQRIIEKAFA